MGSSYATRAAPGLVHPWARPAALRGRGRLAWIARGREQLREALLSPDDRPAEVAAKVADYLRAGTQAVWVVDPDGHAVTMHTSGGTVKYGRDEVLRGAAPLPDFELTLQTVFAEVD